MFPSQRLSLQIRELETSLGGRLVERESRGFLLTPLGRDAHEQTLRILDETLLLETMGKRFEEGPLRVAVGIVSTLAPYLLPGILERLQASSPRIELEVLEASGQDLVSSLLAGRLDAVIVSLPLGILELPERELFEDCFLLAGRAERLASNPAHPGRRPETRRSGPGRYRAAPYAWRRPLLRRPGAGRQPDVAHAGSASGNRVARHAVATCRERRRARAYSRDGRTLRTWGVARSEFPSFRFSRAFAAYRPCAPRRLPGPAMDRSARRGGVGRGSSACAAGAQDDLSPKSRAACPDPSAAEQQGGYATHAIACGTNPRRCHWSPSETMAAVLDAWIAMILSKPLFSKVSSTCSVRAQSANFTFPIRQGLGGDEHSPKTRAADVAEFRAVHDHGAVAVLDAGSNRFLERDGIGTIDAPDHPDGQDVVLSFRRHLHRSFPLGLTCGGLDPATRP